jgi:hypothetical protein
MCRLGFRTQKVTISAPEKANIDNDQGGRDRDARVTSISIIPPDQDRALVVLADVCVGVVEQGTSEGQDVLL